VSRPEGRSATTASADALLSAATAEAYLVSRGLLAPTEAATVAELRGGVSSIVLAVSTPSRTMVVKQALPRLRVDDDWRAKRDRAVTEAAALRLAGSLTPGLVPHVLDADPEACALVIARAPAAWQPWKDLLLAGTADPELAGRLGSALASWHRGTLDDGGVRTRFSDHEAFEQLRVDPYYRTIQRRHPEVAEAVGTLADLMPARRRCLVHGDFSPKNVLAGTDGLWVVDWEVAHHGDPAFDIAFMVNHLLLKAIHRPRGRARYERCCDAFVSAYQAGVRGALSEEVPYVLGHVGCLMLARVDGKSPVEYLSAPERGRAWRLGLTLLLEPPADVGAAWRRLSEVIAR
jgi:5-methylthioribose kinase